MKRINIYAKNKINWFVSLKSSYISSLDFYDTSTLTSIIIIILYLFLRLLNNIFNISTIMVLEVLRVNSLRLNDDF